MSRNFDYILTFFSRLGTQKKEANTGCTGALSNDSDFVFISSKIFNEFLDPTQSFNLIRHASISGNGSSGTASIFENENSSTGAGNCSSNNGAADIFGNSSSSEAASIFGSTNASGSSNIFGSSDGGGIRAAGILGSSSSPGDGSSGGNANIFMCNVSSSGNTALFISKGTTGSDPDKSASSSGNSTSIFSNSAGSSISGGGNASISILACSASSGAPFIFGSSNSGEASNILGSGGGGLNSSTSGTANIFGSNSSSTNGRGHASIFGNGSSGTASGSENSAFEPTCPKGHTLKMKKTDGGYECDLCSCDIAEGKCFYDCRKCDFSMCSKCYETEEAKALEEAEEVDDEAEDENILDVVYEIVVDFVKEALHRSGGLNWGDWVNIASITTIAANRGFSSNEVNNAIRNWEALGIMGANQDHTKIRFEVPFCSEEREGLLKLFMEEVN